MAAQRYETIAKETDIYYSSKCPVVLCAYAVLLDSKMKKYVAQLKLRNCGSEVISSVSVVVRAYDHFDEVAEEINGYQYVGVNVKQGEEFGTKSLIPLSKKVKIKRLEVAVNKIVFSNGSTWDSENGELLDNRLEPQDLASIYSDKDIENYRFMLNSKMKYVPYQKGMLWICSCGEINYGGESCYSCGVDKAKVFDYIIKERLNSALLDPKYNNGIELKKQQSIESLKAAITIFEELGDYKDSKEQISSCKQEIDSIQKEIEAKKQEEERQAELQRKEADEKAKKNKRVAIIAAAIAIVCIAGFFVATNVIIPNAKYNAAVKLMENGDYDAAIEAFEAMNGYKDSEEKIKECEIGIKDQRYNEAVALMEKGDYEAAIEIFRPMRDYKDAEEKMEECQIGIKDQKYNSAIALMEKGDYIGAYKAFGQIADYKDSAELQESIKPKYEVALIGKAEIGGIVSFGAYEQDSNESNGKEPLEWIILSKEDDRALLVSLYGLGKELYNNEIEKVTWETCSLREVLNSPFYEYAFSSGEQTMICTSLLEDDIEDKVFLLSPEEAEKYFASDNKRKCELTAYGWDTGASRAKNNEMCFWFLRTPGSYVDSDGLIKGDLNFHYYNNRYYYTSRELGAFYPAVRPAVWVDLSSIKQ